MPRYTVFGLTLDSPIPLPLPACTAASSPDAIVKLITPAPQPPEQPFISFSDDRGGSRITVTPPGVGQFTVTNGSDISVQPDIFGEFSSFLPLYLTGSILSLRLYQRGLLVLHGSVVRIQNRAVAFLGHSGAGKSSAAAACCEQGYPLLADDIAAVVLSADGALVQPGFPRLKVPSRTARVLNIPPESLVAVHPEIDDEFALPLHDRFCPEPQPLAALYLLEQGERFEITRCPPTRALVELLPHAVPSRYGQNGGNAQFRQLSALVRNVPLFHLLRPLDLKQLSLLPRVVADHLLTLPDSAG